MAALLQHLHIPGSELATGQGQCSGNCLLAGVLYRDSQGTNGMPRNNILGGLKPQDL